MRVALSELALNGPDHLIRHQYPQNHSSADCPPPPPIPYKPVQARLAASHGAAVTKGRSKRMTMRAMPNADVIDLLDDLRTELGHELCPPHLLAGWQEGEEHSECPVHLEQEMVSVIIKYGSPLVTSMLSSHHLKRLVDAPKRFQPLLRTEIQLTEPPPAKTTARQGSKTPPMVRFDICLAYHLQPRLSSFPHLRRSASSISPRLYTRRVRPVYP